MIYICCDKFACSIIETDGKIWYDGSLYNFAWDSPGGVISPIDEFSASYICGRKLKPGDCFLINAKEVKQ